MDIKKILVIGQGSTGIRHLTNLSTCLNKSFELAVLRSKKDFEFKFAKYFYNKNDALLWSPDCVIICTPTDTHCDLINFFRGRNIFVEKPAVLNLLELEKIKEVIFDPFVFQVGFNLRSHSFNKQLPKPEDIKYIMWNHLDYLPNWHPWEDYRQTYPVRDGCAKTLSHGLDLIFSLLRTKIKTISTKKDDKLKIGSDTEFSAKLATKDTVIDYNVSMGIETPSKCELYVETDKDRVLIDYYNRAEPRNESFKKEIIDFISKSFMENVDNNNFEYLSTKLILETSEF